MTHDELLAKLSSTNRRYAGSQDNSALRAVVELHKPTPDGLGCSREYIDCHSRSGLACEDDCNTYAAYPCETIQAIEKEMK